MKECDVEMKYFAWKCLTCEKISKKIDKDEKDEDAFIVCKSCFVGCHIGHEIEMRSVKKDLHMKSVKCPCKSNFSCCLFNLFKNKPSII